MRSYAFAREPRFGLANHCEKVELRMGSNARAQNHFGLQTAAPIARASHARAAQLFLFAGLLALAAVSVAPSPASAREVVATEAQRGKTLRVRPGDRLRVALPSNGTTGFSWTVERMPPHLRLVGDSVEAPTVTPGLVGAEGRQILMFEAKRAGSGTLRLRYRQPWKGGMSDELFVLRIESGRSQPPRRRG